MCVCVCVLRLLREQWIRAKYERKEFTEPAKSFTYEEGERRWTRLQTRVELRRAKESPALVSHRNERRHVDEEGTRQRPVPQQAVCPLGAGGNPQVFHQV